MESPRREETFKEVVKTSLPAVIDLSSQTVTWLIEAIFIGHLSAMALAGVGMAQQFIVLTFSILLTFVVGSSIIIVRYLGAKDEWNANHVLGQALFMGFIFAIFIGLFWFFIVPLLFNLIKEEGAVARNYGVTYIKTVALFSPIIITNFIAIGILRGVGDTLKTMKINLTVNGINLLLDSVLIFGWLGFPRLETFGAALAVGIAHSIGFIVTLYVLRSRKASLFLAVVEITRPKMETFKRLFKMGVPTTVEQFVWSLGQLVLSFFAARMSVTALATHQVLVRIQSVLSMVFWGFGLAGMTLVGKSLGAGNTSEAHRSGKIAAFLALIAAVVFSVVLVLFYSDTISIFTGDEDVIKMGAGVIIAYAILQIPKGLNTVYSGNLRGGADLNWLMWLAICSVIINEITGAYLLAFVFNLQLLGLWVIQIFDETSRLTLNLWRFQKDRWIKSTV
jgi:putative MATE family efflux protein